MANTFAQLRRLGKVSILFLAAIAILAAPFGQIALAVEEVKPAGYASTI